MMWDTGSHRCLLNISPVTTRPPPLLQRYFSITSYLFFQHWTCPPSLPEQPPGPDVILTERPLAYNAFRPNRSASPSSLDESAPSLHLKQRSSIIRVKTLRLCRQRGWIRRRVGLRWTSHCWEEPRFHSGESLGMKTRKVCLRFVHFRFDYVPIYLCFRSKLVFPSLLTFFFTGVDDR